MRATLIGLLFFVAAPVAAQSTASAPRSVPASTEPAIPRIPYKKFVLSNGLTLIVSEDHKAPVVAVNVWYHMGSKNEKPGHTGFAHLYEHLMFGGSEHHPEGFLKAIEPIGATDFNGTTNNDRTNYFETVPISALDRVLWLESDRMGYMVNFIDQKLLDLQRGVVQNEKRQSENEPYGKMWITWEENSYPAGHPYSHSVIGSMDDLNAASLEDVKQWFKDGYGAANATLVIAGDVNTADVKAKVEHYFGEIPAGPVIITPEMWVAPRTEEKRIVLQDRVPQTRIFKAWNVAQFGSADATYLQMATNILIADKTGRLYKRLVHADRTATSVAGFVDTREISGQLALWADVQPGGDARKVEQAMDEEIANFLAKGPTAAELQREKISARSLFLRQVERIGGFGGSSDLLAQGQVFTGNPEEYRDDQIRIANATAAQVQGAAKRWISEGALVLTIQPFPNFEASTQLADRSKVPDVGAPPAATLPAAERATLSNGLKIVLIRRTNIPFVRLWLQTDGGFAADPHNLPGLANMADAMLVEGTATHTSQQIADLIGKYGAYLDPSTTLDNSQLRLGVVKENLDAGLALWAEVLLTPSFPQTELDRLKKITLAQIAQESVDPYGTATRVLPALVFGEQHAYGQPLTGSGTVASVNAMTTGDLATFHRTWLKPNHATLVIVGDITMAEITPKLERVLKDWKPGDVPSKNLQTVQLPERTRVYLIDRPGAEQSLILIGQPISPTKNPQEFGYDVFNDAFGGAFGSRINMNLREDKHWSYGVSSFAIDARGQRLWAIFAPVQTNKTREAIDELKKEIAGVTGDRPIIATELQDSKDRLTRTLAGRFETGSAVAQGLTTIDAFDFPADYYDTYAANIRALSDSAIAATVRKEITPSREIWVVIGDKAKIEAGVRDAGLGTIVELDADGKPKNAAALP